MTSTRKYLLPILLITSCFVLWGFANDITNPMVKAFSKIFRMSVAEGALVQVAFYGGYFAMALPAALFIRRFSFKAGVMLGLALYAAGAFLFYPACLSGAYWPFLAAYFILTCGLSFLETSCNLFIMTLGDRSSAIRRLNLAQAFNPLGSLAGMYVAMHYIQACLSPIGSEERKLLDPAAFEAVKSHDLEILTRPYLAIGCVILVLLIVICFARMPGDGDSGRPSAGKGILRRLWSDTDYRRGVVAQFFYVGVQIMVWTFIIQYGTSVFMNQGFSERDAEVISQRYNILAMVLFCLSRFICTALMRYFRPAAMLVIFALAGALLALGVVLLGGMVGLWCLVGISACMSLMFPTIYGIALRGLSPDDSKLGAAGLIMAILGGSVLPPLQGLMIDHLNVAGISAVNLSFILPLLCLLIVAAYGRSALRSPSDR